MVAMRDSSGMALAVGRFAGWEPLGFEAGDENWYRFVANAPTAKTDPFGLKSLNEIGSDVRSWIQSHVSGRGGISHTLPPLKFLVYAPPPTWLETNLTVSGEVFSCVHPQTRQTIAAFQVEVSIDGFVAVGFSLRKGVPGPRNERIPNPNNPSTTVKRKNAPGEPGSGSRERNRYGEITLSSDCQVCPKTGWTKIEGAAFFRGSAGLGVGYQFNVQKAINDSFTDITSGWSVTGGRAWGTAGVSLEAGLTVSSYLVGYMQ